MPNNEGIRRARGSYIAYLGHDDLWFPWHLSGLVERIEEAGADLVCCLVAMMDKAGVRSVMGRPPRQAQTGWDPFVPPSVWLHRRDLTDRIGGWSDPKELRTGPGTEFLQRVSRNGGKISFCEQLGALKFESRVFSSYSPSGEVPQRAAFAALRTDAEALYSDTLLKIVVGRPAAPPPAPNWRSRLKTTAWRLRERIYSAYGEDRWPVKNVLIARNQKRRARVAIERGLDHGQVPGANGKPAVQPNREGGMQSP